MSASIIITKQLKRVPAKARCVWKSDKSELARQTVLSDLMRAGNRQMMMNVRQDHIVPDFPRLANMAWTFDLAKQHALSQPIISLSAHTSIPPEPCAQEL